MTHPSSAVFRRQRSRHENKGFTMVELAVATAVIGIFTSMFVIVGLANWRRERVNALTQQLAGWIEEVMVYSMRENMRCDVSITTGTSLEPGTVVAQVTNPGCPFKVNPATGRTDQMVIPGLVSPGGDSYTIGPGTGNPITFTYTPRGTLTAPGQTNPADLEIRVVLNPAGRTPERPMRCIRLSSTLGLISLGRNNTAAAPDPESDTCTEYDAI